LGKEKRVVSGRRGKRGEADVTQKRKRGRTSVDSKEEKKRPENMSAGQEGAKHNNNTEGGKEICPLTSKKKNFSFGGEERHTSLGVQKEKGDRIPIRNQSCFLREEAERDQGNHRGKKIDKYRKKGPKWKKHEKRGK